MIRRVSTYYRVLDAQRARGAERISSERLSALTGFTAAQVRRDLAFFGSFGKRGVGYAVSELRRELAAILGIDRGWRIGLVGVGNLGMALLSYPGFARQGFHIVAAYDLDPRKLGARFGPVRVESTDRLADSIREHSIEIVMLAVPADAAQAAAEQAVAGGARAILNFAPVNLQLPDHIQLSSVDLSLEVEYLTYSLTH
jgi:redox-sensing transcriptional repressor